MLNRSVKSYKNPARSITEPYNKYVPQYKIKGIEPEIRSPTGLNQKSSSPMKQSSIRQPYAQVIPPHVGRGRSPVPNIGNNMEHTWSSIDGDFVEDLSGEEIDPNKAMIDNNEFMTQEADAQDEQKPFLTQQDLEETFLQEQNMFDNIGEGEFFILIKNKILSCGTLEEIQEETKQLLFGEHSLVQGAVPIEDVTVLKKISIKMGVFLQ